MSARSLKAGLDIDWSDEASKYDALNILVEQLESLQLWIEAHALQKAKQVPAAATKYIAFLGVAGHRSLPDRYAEMARDRLEELHAPVRESFEAACRDYPKDRAKGRAAFKALAERWPMLPEGRAAKHFWHSDEQRGAIDRAKDLQADGKKKEAATLLEAAVRAYVAGLYKYEATTLLVELGGPDLRPREKDRPVKKDLGDTPPPEKDDGGESEIEIND